jgi:hypothetical protein
MKAGGTTLQALAWDRMVLGRCGVVATSDVVQGRAAGVVFPT